MIRKYLDGGATETDGRASAPVGPSVATPVAGWILSFSVHKLQYKILHSKGIAQAYVNYNNELCTPYREFL